jgi:hypothetical protein
MAIWPSLSLDDELMRVLDAVVIQIPYLGVRNPGAEFPSRTPYPTIRA